MTISTHPFDWANGSGFSKKEQELIQQTYGLNLKELMVTGKIDNVRKVGKFGYNLAVGSSVEDIWSPGGIYTFRTTPTIVECLSASSDDDVDSGTGAQIVQLLGIYDNNGVRTYGTENIELQGTSPVDSVKSWWLVYSMKVVQRGTYNTNNTNAGVITCRVDGAGATMNEIPVDAIFGGTGTSFNTHYETAFNEHAFLYYVLTDKDTGKTVDLTAEIMTGVNDVTAPFTGLHLNQIIHRDIPNFMQWDLNTLPFYLPPHTHINFKGYSSGAGTAVSINYGMMVITEKA